MSRVNPFEELAEFDVQPKSKPVDPKVIERVAQDNNFPSRQPANTTRAAGESKSKPARGSRRYVTGRNRQINIKATDATINRLYRLADAAHVPLGELLERALDALERAAPPSS
jgi:hypothetical protein